MSDRTGRKPKGTMTRPAPDWFSDHMGTGGFWTVNTVAGMDLYVEVQLFNNAQDGSLLKVYGITAGNDSGFGMFMFARQGNPPGVLVANGFNVRPDLAPPIGQIWQRTSVVAPNTPNPNPPPAGSTLLGTPGFDSNSWFSPFPLAVIAPGWSTVIVNTSDTATVFAAYWWQQSAI